MTAGYGEPGYGAGVGEHPAVMVGRIPLDQAGDVAGEVIRQAADDRRDGRHVRVGEAADDVHYGIVPHLAGPSPKDGGAAERPGRHSPHPAGKQARHRGTCPVAVA